uniref:UDP-glucuronosyltransferase n=1 Tax=Scleropages formosus TaxID=113540 RepID=A0A8C9RVJ1_SCLFO
MDRKGWAASTLGLLSWLSACTVGPAQGGKLLVMPVDGSHWLSMEILVKELSRRGHDAVVLLPETSFLIRGSDHYRNEVFRVPYTIEELDASVNAFKRMDAQDFFSNVQNLLNFSNMQIKGCEGLLYDTPLMDRLQGEGFDIVLTDPFLPCGPLIAETFAIPPVYFLRGLPCGLEYEAIQCPTPPSYIPRFFSGNTDVMNFPQRVKNILFTIQEYFVCSKIYASFDELTSRYLGRDTTYGEVLSHGAVWLMRYDFTFEYPRPLMPNMVLIGGINCAKINPLPATFVDESGEHGFVVFTLGTLVSEISEERTQQFLQAFRRIPQKVLWRHTGPRPANVPHNVKLMKWLPQNDLLGHPKARAFMTHGGTHGLYEGICNAVPMVLMPLFGDQGENILHMEVRGVGVVLRIHDTTSEQIVWALNKVINDTRLEVNFRGLQ